MENCIFCKIVNKEMTANIVFENEKCIVFTPTEPVTSGHLLISPKTHFKDIFEIDKNTLSEIMAVAKDLAVDFAKDNNIEGVNILHASGRVAQQSIFHFHIHVVPRRLNDGLDLWFGNKI